MIVDRQYKMVDWLHRLVSALPVTMNIKFDGAS